MCGHQNSIVGKFLSHLFDAHKVNLKLDPTAIWHWRCPLCPRVEPAVGLLQAHLAKCALHFNLQARLLLAPASASAHVRGPLVDDDVCYLLKDPQELFAPMPPPAAAIAHRDPLVYAPALHRGAYHQPNTISSTVVISRLAPAQLGAPGQQLLQSPLLQGVPLPDVPNYDAALSAASRGSRPPPPPLPSKSNLNHDALRTVLRKHAERNRLSLENESDPLALQASHASAYSSDSPNARTVLFQPPVIDLNLARAVSESTTKKSVKKSSKQRANLMANRCIRK